MTTPQQVAAAIDAALEPLGFSRANGLAQTSWSGETHGRNRRVSIAARKRTRYSGEVRRSELLGYQLRIELGTTTHVRLFFVRSGFARSMIVRWLYRLRRQKVIGEVPPALQGFCVVTPDPEWSRPLLQDPEAIAAIAHLLTEDAAPNFAGSVHFAPGTVHYASPIVPLERLTPLHALTQLDRLEALAVGAERLPAPEIPAQTTGFEAWAQHNPLALALAVIAGLMLILLIGAGLMIVIAAMLMR